MNQRLASDDKVIAFDQPLPHYLSRTDSVFIRYGTGIHDLVAGCGGQRDLWSNAPLLSSDEQVEHLIASSRGNVWLIMRSERYQWRDPLEIKLAVRYEANTSFTSQDGMLVVYRIPPSAAP